MIAHHPGDELLMGYAARTLDLGAAIVIGAHLEGCADCHATVRAFESAGGAMLESIDPVPMSREALANTLAMIGRPSAVRPGRRRTRRRPDLPSGVAWPRSLAGCGISPWRWMGPGMRWSRVSVPHDRDANVFLLRIGAGKALANHTHSGVELTHVMCGSFHDGHALFAAGDFDAADGSVRHQPVLETGGECICLASVKGRLVFDSAIARVIGSFVGI